MKNKNVLIRYLIIGAFTRNTTVTASGRILIDQPGGNLLYAGGGTGLWDKNIGLLGKVGSDFPEEWVKEIVRRGFEFHGLISSDQTYDMRHFFAYDTEGNRDMSAPVSIFSKIGEPLPRTLLGYGQQESSLDSRNRPSNLTIRSKEIASDLYDATAAHLCPIDFISHSLLPGELRQGNIQTITIDPASGYMKKAFWDAIPDVVGGITGFLPSEEEVLSLFEGRTRDLRVISETLAGYGCEYVVIKRGEKGVLVYERVSRDFWEVPAYPVNVVDPTGAGDAFCGGFLAGLRLKYDVVEAALYGSVSASFKVQGSGPFFPMDSLPELVEARLGILREQTKKVT